MLDIGFTELLLIAIVALVVLGPEKLPVAVKTLGLWIGKAKRTINGIQSEISEELRLDEMKRTAAIHKEQLDKELGEMKKPFVTEIGEAEAFPTAPTEVKERPLSEDAAVSEISAVSVEETATTSNNKN